MKLIPGQKCVLDGMEVVYGKDGAWVDGIWYNGNTDFVFLILSPNLQKQKAEVLEEASAILRSTLQ
jgi:hypothetical protein